MKELRTISACLITLVCMNTQVKAQGWDDDSHTLSLTINQIANTVIRPASQNVVLTLIAPSGAGGQYTSTNSDSTTWLNYTSVIVPAGSNNLVYAQISSGSLPSGVNLELTASASSTGTGTVGSPTSQINLSGSAQNIVTGIGSAQTDRGSNFGHRLKYRVLLTDVSALEFDDTVTLTVTYTISN